MVYTLFVHDDAKADLAALWVTDRKAAALVVTAFQEIAGDQRLLDSLTDHGFGSNATEPIEVKKWLEFWNSGANIWRLKFWNLHRLGLAYRAIYAYEPSRRRYHVLGVFPRSFNYSLSDPRTQRVKRAYDNL
jgi:hypothetical protein